MFLVMKTISSCHVYPPKAVSIKLKNDDLLNEILEYAKRQNSLVSIQVLNSGNVDSRGYIDSTDDGICKVRQVNDFGVKDGFGYIKTDDVSRVSINDEKEKGIDLLYKLNNPD